MDSSAASPRLSTLLPSVRTAHCSSEAVEAKVVPVEYYALCGLGGALATGLTYGFTSGEYFNWKTSFTVYSADPEKFKTTPLKKLEFVRRPRRPLSFTTLGYGMQGFAKFGLYEAFKKAVQGDEAAYNNRFLLYGPAAAAAHLLASGPASTEIWRNFRIDTQFIAYKYSKERSGKMLSRAMLHSAIQFTIYEWIMEVLRKRHDNESPTGERQANSFGAGFTAGFACALITHPYKALGRSAQHAELLKAYGGKLHLFNVRTSGMVLASGLQWLIYEGFKIAAGISDQQPNSKQQPEMPESLRKKLEESKLKKMKEQKPAIDLSISPSPTVV